MDRIVWRKVETKENAEREHTAKSSRKGDISNPQPATPRGASWHVGTRVSRKDLAPDLSGRQIFEDFWHFHGQANFESNFRKSTPGPSELSKSIRALRAAGCVVIGRNEEYGPHERGGGERDERNADNPQRGKPKLPHATRTYRTNSLDRSQIPDLTVAPYLPPPTYSVAHRPIRPHG